MNLRMWAMLASTLALAVLLGGVVTSGSTAGAVDDDLQSSDAKAGDESFIVDPITRDAGISAEVFSGIEAVRAYGPSAHPDVYTGIATNDPSSIDVLVIYLTTADERIRDAFRAASGVPAEKVRFQLSTRTESEHRALNDQIGKDRPTLREQGIDIHGWGVGAGFVEEIYVGAASGGLDGENAENDGATVLRARYGDDIKVITDAAPGADLGRADDNPQWYGGDFITIGSGGCTTSFAVRWIGHPNQYIVTAGHCGQLTQNVYNKIAPPVNIGAGGLIGGITNRTYNPNGYDAALIAADGSRAIWTGSSAAPTGTILVTGVLNAWDGAPACTSGAYEGEYCGWAFSGQPSCYPWSDGGTGYWCNLQKMVNPSSQAVGQGDSGGPVYASINGVVYGYGIIKGGGNSSVCSNWNSYFNGSRRCSNEGYTQRLSSIMNQWSLELDP